MICAKHCIGVVESLFSFVGYNYCVICIFGCSYMVWTHGRKFSGVLKWWRCGMCVCKLVFVCMYWYNAFMTCSLQVVLALAQDNLTVQCTILFVNKYKIIHSLCVDLLTEVCHRSLIWILFCRWQRDCVSSFTLVPSSEWQSLWLCQFQKLLMIVFLVLSLFFFFFFFFFLPGGMEKVENVAYGGFGRRWGGGGGGGVMHFGAIFAWQYLESAKIG